MKYRSRDNSFVVDNYHVTAQIEQYAGQYAELVKLHAVSPEQFITEVSPIDARLDILEELAGIDKMYRTPRILAQAQCGDEYALAQLQKAETLAEPLRKQLKITGD